MKTTRTLTAWADVGSHGGIFYFDSGEIGRRYPGLLHIYREKRMPTDVKVTITYEWPREEGQ